jgi:8-oxo-dGTP diphosphatase
MSSHPHVRVGVGALLSSPTSPPSLLAGVRLGSHGAGRLALPGGHLEFGESWAECAAREVLEETGIAVSPGAFETLSVSNDVMRAEGRHYVTIVMAARLPAGAKARNLEPDKVRDRSLPNNPRPSANTTRPG